MSATEEREQTFKVSGMTCAHCVAAVEQSAASVSGTRDIAVDLEGGLLTVIGCSFEDSAVEAAVTGAGYAVEVA